MEKIDESKRKAVKKFMCIFFASIMLLSIIIAAVALCLRGNGSDTVVNITVAMFSIMIIVLSLGISIYGACKKKSLGKEIIILSLQGICFTLTAGIVIAIFQPIVENSIRLSEKMEYDTKSVIEETISNYERTLIREETEKALLDNDYKSKFIKDNGDNIENVKKKIENDVIKKINTEK